MWRREAMWWLLRESGLQMASADDELPILAGGRDRCPMRRDFAEQWTGRPRQSATAPPGMHVLTVARDDRDRLVARVETGVARRAIHRYAT